MNISIAFLEINLNVFNVTLILTITLVVSLCAILQTTNQSKNP